MKALMFLFMLFLHPLLAQNSDWLYRNTYPQNNFYKIKFFNHNTGFIAGEGGYILKTTNGCASFQFLSTNTSAIIYDMHFLSQQIYFAVGENSTIIYTSNGGNSWVNIFQVSNSPALKSIKFSDPLTGFAAGNNGRMLKTTNGGFNWSILTPLTHLNLNYISFQNGTGWICADSGWIYKTTNGGNSWEGDSLNWQDNNYIYFTNASTGFLATGSQFTGSSGNLYKTTDGGNSWQSESIGMIARSWYSIHFINSNTGFVTGRDAPVLVTTNGGQYWNICGVPPSTTMNSISVSDTLAFICGTNGWISRIGVSGNHVIFGGSKKDFNSISFINENTGIVSGDYQVNRTTSSGTKWNIRMFGSVSWFEGASNNPIGSKAFPTGNIYLVTHSYTPAWFPTESLLKSTDGGQTFNYCYSSYGYLNGFDEADGTVYISHTSTVIKSTGGSYSYVYTVTGSTLGDISFANQNTGIVLHNGNSGINGMVRTTNGGVNWVFNQNINNKYIYHIELLPSGRGYAASDSGYFFKTTNFGSSWQYLNTGLNGTNLDIKFINDDIGWLLNALGNWPQSYRLYFTKNGGLNFYPITSLGSFNVKAFSFIDANTGFVAGDSGVVLKTTNGGLTFVNQTGELYPDNYSLSQNYPNPFNPVTNIRFDIPKSGFVKIIVYDLLGREITQLVNQQMQPGSFSVDWDASNYPSGVYFYKLVVGDNTTSWEFVETRKMVLIK
jgi:photosystem II stability/assembly factor-like uncharacterized protein